MTKNERFDYLNSGKPQRITNLTYRDAPHVSIEGGEWTNVSEIPTALDRANANIEYLQMCMDYLMANGGTNE